MRVSLTTVACTLVLGVVALLVVYPVVLLVVHSFEVGAFGRETHWGLENWAAALTETQLTSAIWNTVSLAVSRQVIGLALAIGVAWLLGCTNLPGARWLEFGFWVAVFLPSLTVLVAWSFVPLLVPPEHLYRIVSALRRVGLGYEARMIAAEAVARG